jgi:hypothetical protein
MERDVEVIETLYRYRIMRESTLHRLCFPTVKDRRKVQARLKQLRDAGYISRPDPRHFRHSDSPYWVDKLGVEELLNGHPLTDEQRERLRVNKKLSQWTPHRHKHLLDLSDIRACLELADEQVSDVYLKGWGDEHDQVEQGPLLYAKVMIAYDETDKLSPFTLIPDACFTLEDKGGERKEFFFVEVDEGNEAHKRWRKKVLAYLAYLGQGFTADFEAEDFRVLTITRSQGDKDQVKHKQTLLKTTFNAGGRGEFWFTTFDELMPGGVVAGEHFLTGKVWQRAREREIKEKVVLALRDHLFL